MVYSKNESSDKERAIKMRSLADIPLFQALPEAELLRLQREFLIRDYAVGEILIREGQASDNFYVILEGIVEVVKALGTPEEMSLGLRRPGEFIGEMGLLNPDGLRTATACVKEPAKLVEVPFRDFIALIGRYPKLALELAGVLSSRMTQAQDEAIQILEEKNERLQRAYDELKAAQAQLVEKERFERELQLAREIQQSILPTAMPPLRGYDFGALMEPARMVGGDFYGIFPLDEERMALIVGDVTDKGAPAALFMAQTHALLRAAAAADLRPAEVLQRVNAFLLEMNDKGLFATVIYGILDRRSGLFGYARAGHELPLVVDPSGQATFPSRAAGMPLGILDDPMIDENEIEIPPGGWLFLYSDGVPDCADPGGNPYTLERFIAQAQAIGAQETAQGACLAIWRALEAFQQEAAQFDDVTVLVARRASGEL